jgi:biopolymer transport protein ExbD
MRVRIENWWHVFALTFVVVAAIILVFRIATTPMFGGSYPVEVRFSQAASFIDGDERDLFVTVPKDNPVLIGRVYAADDDLRHEFQELALISRERRILLRVDRAAKVATFRRVLNAASSAGFTNFIIVTFEGSGFDLLVRTKRPNSA